MLARFLDFLFPPREDESVLRAVDEKDLLSLLAPELVYATKPPAVALLPFADKRVRAAIHEAKYRGTERAFGLLASALADYLAEIGEESFEHVVIVPIPLGVARQKERGYNQVEEVAKRAIGGMDIKIENELLVRTRETASQISLPRAQRARNMRGAFGAAGSVSTAHLYIVLDDVLTTGATLSAAILALEQAGAKTILPLALAH